MTTKTRARRAPSGSHRKRTGDVSIRDVAKRAACSAATVSRVINEPDQVSESTQKRVLQAIKELGYVRNNAARTLRQNQTRLIGVIIPTLQYAIYAGFVEGLQESVKEADYSLLIATSGYDLDVEAEHATLLIERGVEGLVLVGARRNPSLANLLEIRAIPTVSTYVYDPTAVESTIGIDNVGIGAQMVDRLADLGHREFAMISGPTHENDRAAGRVKGFLGALARHRLPAGRSRVVEAPYVVDRGRAAMQRILGRPTRPTAIVCGSDMLALGALIECQAQGIRVPEDISILGMDNLEFTAHVNPPLSTFEVPSTVIGRRAGQHILSRCAGALETVHVRYEPRFIPRGTIGPAPS